MIDKLTKPEIQDFIEEHLYDDPSQLMLKANHYPDWPMKQIVEQIQSKRKAKTKLPLWFQTAGLVYPSVLSMEQCSSENTARYKKSLLSKGKRMLDLTGGFGVDFTYLSQGFLESHYVERQAELTDIAKHNFEKLGLKGYRIHQSNAEDVLSQSDTYDLIYLDPARRGDQNEKVVRLENCEPNVLEMLPSLLTKSKQVMIKTSPLLDIKGAIHQLQSVSEVHILAVGNEVKELLFLLDKAWSKKPKIQCVNLLKSGKQQFDFTYDAEEQSDSVYEVVQEYLYEPNAAILKAGGFKSIGNAFGLSKLHVNSHLYTSTEFVTSFPGRAFRVIEKISLNKKALKKHFPTMKANITIRNFPMTVAQIRQKSGLKEGGSQYLFGTTDQGGKQLVLCEKIEAN